MSILVSLPAALLLATEGCLLATALLRVRGHRVLRCALGLPLGSLVNALLFTLLDVAGVPFSLLSVGIAHGVVLLGLWVAMRRTQRVALHDELPIPVPRWIAVAAAVIIVLNVVPAALHALTIPSITWDSFTNWAMRAQVSLAAGRFVTEGVVQPQYPVLLHSLQMLPMLGGEWRDQATKIITLLLSLSTGTALFAMLRIMMGTRAATVLLAVLTAVPLAHMHLRQGYADLHWAGFALLALTALTIGSARRSPPWLMLSALCIAAAAWTKYEGLYFGFVPWCIALVHAHRSRSAWRAIILPLCTAAALIVPWPLRTLFLGDLVSPHALVVGFHPEGILPLVRHLFLYGSFGMHWWLIVALFGALLCTKKLYNYLGNPGVCMGALSAFGVIAAYLCTADVKGLVQGDNFSRAMIGPTVLMTLGLSIMICMLLREEQGSRQ